MDVIREIVQRGGLAATHELLKAGATSYGISRAVAAGRIIRVRQGWYGLPELDRDSAESARVGGRTTCTSGARAHGLWVMPTNVLHVHVGEHDSRLRMRTDYKKRLADSPDTLLRVHWGHRKAAGTRFLLLPRECLRDMVLCESVERVLAAAESAVRAGMLTRNEWLRDISHLPKRLRLLLAEIDPRSESIIETITRFRLRRLGYLPLVQVSIRGVGRVDLLIGRLVIELDGWQFHQNRESFEEDRRRDAALAARGYLVLRFTYRQVTRQWSTVIAAIEGCLARP